MASWDTESIKLHGAEPNILLEFEYNQAGDKVYVSRNKLVTASADAPVYKPKLLSVGSTTHKVENWEGGFDFSTSNITFSNLNKGEMDTELTYIRAGRKLINKNAEIKLHFNNTGLSEAKTVLKGKIKGDTEKLGKWTLKITDSRKKYTRNIPHRTYTIDEFPNLQESQINTHVPYLFGEKKSIVPTQIDTTERQFKICDIALYETPTIYYDKVEETPLSVDLPNATFKLSRNAFTVKEDDSPTSALLYITDDTIYTWVDPDGANAAVPALEFSDLRYNTVGAIVDYFNNTAVGYTASIYCARNVPSTKLALVVDQEIHTVENFIVELQVPEHGQIVCDAIGGVDTAAGKYTGTANASIELPGDWIYYIMGSICGMPDAEIGTTSITSARTTWSGFVFGAYIDSPVDAFSLCQQIAKEAYMWCYWDSADNVLTLKNADIDMNEAVDNYYYEDKPYAKILKDSYNKERDDKDIYNKIEVYYNYDKANSLYNNKIICEDTISQDEDTGYGTINNLVINSQWIGKDFSALNIEYTGTGLCSIDITGEGTDTDRRFYANIWDGGGGNEFDLDLTSASFDTLLELATHINNDTDYSCSVVDPDYNNLDSRGLRDIDDKVLGITYVDKFGDLGAGEGSFSYPTDVCFNSTHIFVADGNNHRIQKFLRSDYSFASEEGSYGEGDASFDGPWGIACDETNVYVADAGNSRISKFTTNLVFASKDNGGGTMSYPYGITVCSDAIYVADLITMAIYKYTESTFEYASKIDTFGSGNGELSFPIDVTVNDTNVFVADKGNYRIQKFNKGLYYVAKGAEGETCFAVACDNDFVYMTNAVSKKVIRYNTDLVKIQEFSKNDDGEGIFDTPQGIFASEDSDDLYVADGTLNKIIRLDKSKDRLCQYSYAKLLALKTLAQKKDPQDRIKFNTSLYGLNQSMGKILYTRRLDEDRDTRMRVTQITRDPQNYKVSIAGRQEGIPLDNLIGRWNMTQATGANAPDSSGNGYTLTTHGTTVQQGGDVISTDNGDYFDLAHADCGLLNITGNNPMTIVGKIKMTGNASAAMSTIIAKWESTDDNRQWAVGTVSGHVIQFDICSNGATAENTQSTLSIPKNVWGTFACVYNTKDIRIYINGTLDEGAGCPVAYTGGIYASGTGLLEVGRRDGSNTYDFEGDIAYVGMFDVALNYGEVMYIHEYWK